MRPPRWHVIIKRQRRHQPSAIRKSKQKWTIRPLHAPRLVGRYEIVLKMMACLTEDDDQMIRATLYDLIPGRFKIVRCNKWRAVHRRQAKLSTIRSIHLKHESDLVAVQIAFKEKIWRILRVIDQPKAVRGRRPDVWQAQRTVIVGMLLRVLAMLQR